MTARPIPGGRDPTQGHPPSGPSEAGQATTDSLNTEPVRLLAIRFGEELRRRRREAGLHQQDLADRIAYHRSYLSQVERGRQVPAEQFAMLCDRALEARGALMGVFRELAAEREARRREVAAERWRARFLASTDAPAEAIAVPESALVQVAGASLASSDRSVERRPFVRMVGTFASAAMLESLGVDLLNLLRAMQGSRVSRPMLEETELAVLRFHQLYKELPPTELFPHVQQYQQAVTGLLAESQTIEVRRRLCSIAGHLVGLCQVGARACPWWRSQRGAGRWQTGQAPAQHPSSTCNSSSSCHKLRPTPPVSGGAAAPGSGTRGRSTPRSRDGASPARNGLRNGLGQARP